MYTKHGSICNVPHSNVPYIHGRTKSRTIFAQRQHVVSATFSNDYLQALYPNEAKDAQLSKVPVTSLYPLCGICRIVTSIPE